MQSITIRPKGFIYIFYTMIKYIFLFGLLSLAIFVLLRENPFNANDIFEIILSIFIVIMSLVLLFFIVLQTREIIRYKLILFDDKVFLAANRDVFLTRQKDIQINYYGICAIHYNKELRPDLIQKGMFFFSAIYIMRNEGKKEDYLLTMWFSKKQIDYIMEQICMRATEKNGYTVQILTNH